MNCLGVQQRQQHHNSSSAAHKKMSYLWSPTQCWQAAQLRSADSFTVSVLNEENWDACLVERFPLPLYGLPHRTSRPPDQDLRDATTQTLLGKCHATEKHCVPDIPYSCTCMSDLLQRSQKQNPQPLLPVNNQSARALVQHAVHQVRHFFRIIKKTSRARSKLPATHGIHGIAWICACHCLLCLGREGMELILQLPAICARSWPFGSPSSSGTLF